MRKDVAFAIEQFPMTERRACKLVGLDRSSYRYEPRRFLAYFDGKLGDYGFGPVGLPACCKKLCVGIDATSEKTKQLLRLGYYK